MKEDKQTYKKIYTWLFYALPWVLLLGIFQQSYWRFFPLKRFFSGPEFWDWITIVDLYVVGIVAVFAIGMWKKDIEIKKDRLRWEVILGVGLIMLAGVLEIFFQKTYEPVLSSAAEYFRSMFLFPILIFVLGLISLNKEDMEKMVMQYLKMVGVFCALALVHYFTGLFPGEQMDFMGRLNWPYIDFMTLKSASSVWVSFIVTPALVIASIKLGSGINVVLKEIKGKKGMELVKAWFKKCGKTRIVALIVVLSGLTLFLTQTYGAFAAYFAAMALYFFRALKPKQMLVGFMVLALIGSGLYMLQKSSLKYQILTNQTAYKYDNSAAGRTDIYKLALSIIKEHPLLGVGLNQFQSYFAANQERVLGHKFNESQVPPHPHDFFLSMWDTLGVFGFLGMLILIIGAFWRSGLKVENLAVFALTGMMVHGVIDSYYWKIEIAYLLWMVLMWVYLAKVSETSSD